MTEATVTEQTILEKLAALLRPAIVPEPVKPTGIEPEKFAAVEKERDELAAKMAKIEADNLLATTVSTLAGELQNADKFSATFNTPKAATEAATVLAGMTKEQQDWTMQQLGALSKRIDYSKLTAELGSDGANTETDPVKAFSAAVEAKMKANKINYVDAYALVKIESADLFSAFAAARAPQKEK